MKKILLAVSLIALVASFAIIVNAHSGKTDGSGGHIDYATGEYHYHHGYPAHSHYDMDCDGKVDCPYEFKDNTNHSSGNRVETDKEPVVVPPSENNATEDAITLADVLKAMLSCLLPAVGIGISASYFLSYLFLFLFGDDKGCSVTMILLVVISIAAYILLIISYLRSRG